MGRYKVKGNHAGVVFQQWRYKQEQKLESQREQLREERKKIERERKALEREKRDYTRWKDTEKSRLESESKLFAMKWKLLEEELKNLADEKLQVEKQRNFYRYVEEHEKKVQLQPLPVNAEMFFVGVDNKKALKRRYKELLKIYHPDNLAGDTAMIQEINREYDRLSKKYEQ